MKKEEAEKILAVESLDELKDIVASMIDEEPEGETDSTDDTMESSSNEPEGFTEEEFNEYLDPEEIEKAKEQYGDNWVEKLNEEMGANGAVVVDISVASPKEKSCNESDKNSEEKDEKAEEKSDLAQLEEDSPKEDKDEKDESKDTTVSDKRMKNLGRFLAQVSPRYR